MNDDVASDARSPQDGLSVGRGQYDLTTRSLKHLGPPIDRRLIFSPLNSRFGRRRRVDEADSMFKNKVIENTLPLREQETAIGRMRGESWIIDTSEPTVARLLIRKGYLPVGDDEAGQYVRFELPAKALTIRSRKAMENPRQATNLPNRPLGAERLQESAKAGQGSSQDRAIDDVDDSSPAPGAIESELAPKSPKGDKSTAGTPDIEIRLAGRSE
jgi:hypothetical protein